MEVRPELLPDSNSERIREWAPNRALSPSVRSFGKFVDTAALRQGDLVLTREVLPDRISQLITSVQIQGGYASSDAIWTHAAMYVGDGQHVVEATFDSVATGGSVRMTPIDEYCGKYALRFRRPIHVVDAETAWLLVVRAMTRIRAPYALIDAAKMWIDVKFRNKGFWSTDKKWHEQAQGAVICSTLYADSYNEVTRRSLGEVNGACVPAWLNMSDEFTDVSVDWVAIRGAGRPFASGRPPKSS
jgi:hypothetical protein